MRELQGARTDRGKLLAQSGCLNEMLLLARGLSLNGSNQHRPILRMPAAIRFLENYCCNGRWNQIISIVRRASISRILETLHVERNSVWSACSKRPLRGMASTVFAKFSSKQTD